MKKLMVLLLSVAICCTFCGCQQNFEDKGETQEETQEIEYKTVSVNGLKFEIPENWEGNADEGETATYSIKDSNGNDVGHIAVIVAKVTTDVESFSKYCVGLFDGSIVNADTVTYTHSFRDGQDICEFEASGPLLIEETYLFSGKTVTIKGNMTVFTLHANDAAYETEIQEGFDHMVDSMFS